MLHVHCYMDYSSVLLTASILQAPSHLEVGMRSAFPETEKLLTVCRETQNIEFLLAVSSLLFAVILTAF
jgi:hypothetical protein